MVNFIAIKVRNMKIWDAKQRGDKGGNAFGVRGAFVNVYTCLITKLGRRFINVYRSLIKDNTTEYQYIANFYTFAGKGGVRI